MAEVPWWARSPSPMSLLFYALMGLYGAHRMGAKTPREWIREWAASVLLFGLIILPYDVAWQLLQWIKFGQFYPDEIIMIRNVLIRDGVLFLWFLYESRSFYAPKGPIRLKGLIYLLIPISSLLLRFLFLAPDPGWTDWTYGMRYSSSIIWWQQYLSGIPDRILQALAYYKIWK